jgi:hypothetical protein
VGIVVLTIFVAASLTSTSWASEGAGFFIGIAFPVLLLAATFPLAVGGVALFAETIQLIKERWILFLQRSPC